MDFGMLSKMCASSPGARFDAHPAHFTVAVKRIFLCVIIELSVFGCQFCPTTRALAKVSVDELLVKVKEDSDLSKLSLN